MQTQTIQFAVEAKDGIVKRIGKSTIYQPKASNNGKGIRWYKDKPKTKGN